MPIYEYRCRKCKTVTESIHGISDPPPAACPSCGGRVERLMSPGAFILKGNGFYATDYKRSGEGTGEGKGKGKEGGGACPASGAAGGACGGCPKAG